MRWRQSYEDVLVLRVSGLVFAIVDTGDEGKRVYQRGRPVRT